MFNTVIVANRGEIAVRIMRTLRALGVRSVAVYSDADANSRHVREADLAVRLGPAPSRQSYLSIERVMNAAVSTGADALHPGYGFLAENDELADQCARAGIVFVGPPASAIRSMGDKIQAKRTVAAAGVRVVPGSELAGLTDEQLVQAANDVGLPVLLKPSAGGGGKGMRLVRDAAELQGQIASARREALGAFGDDTLLVERYIERPRHIEIQVLADEHGNIVHLGERECSLQRRHQKIVEEAPSPFVSAEVRDAMGAQAVEAARSCGYTNAGTVEMIVSANRPDEFFFMEMNTRLQVEHPVTELAYGIDLVEMQLRIASGEVTPWAGHTLTPQRHAIEARVYAEDPARGFLPTGGVVHRLREPDVEGVRVDSSLFEGMFVGSDYDPMLAKIISVGVERKDALRRLDRALAATTVLGVTTNIGFLRDLLCNDEVARGELDTGLVERLVDAAVTPPVPDDVIGIAALYSLAPTAATVAAGTTAPVDPWATTGGWRVGGAAPIRRRVEVPGHGTVEAVCRSTGDGWELAIDGGTVLRACLVPSETRWSLTLDGVTAIYDVHADGSRLWVGRDGRTWALHVESPSERTGTSASSGSQGAVRAPMPGRVIAVQVSAGDSVVLGQPLAIVEAMKMEHTLTAPFDGVVAEVHVTVGQQVALDELIVAVVPATAAAVTAS